MFYPKDFISTADGLVFAVVSDVIEDDRVLCFLRYVQSQGRWRKVNTHAANELLAQHHPHLLFHSDTLDADLHAVAIGDIVRHYQPRQRLAEMMAAPAADPVERDCRRLCGLLSERGVSLQAVGVTGSLLPGFQGLTSDIDLVFYGRDVFHQARTAMQRLVEQGTCQALSDQDWQESYRRRDCDLSLQEYVWHERRKFNKTMISGRKVDLNMIVNSPQASIEYSKLGRINLQTQVIDDERAFDYPAEFVIDNERIASVVCFTATYTGQAKRGERIDVAGQLEQAADGSRRIVVGSSREAQGEYIKVLHAH
ncbi:hypothetical protein Q9L42_015135 [Methylomarinum sp. Ch1-1]|uniref:Polymerase nucleotidyl transferase domain-containing protein n=1 Tax=Methylomarinum roseum TaxID=3067653 RepID=A0AAU7NRU6_9GAMM|nr:hypothetical protein [Methylomarinum sp. Ch1-1]MDP4520345.1 hypothetical protein [Methylomarinum sp. Ch1-1]